MNMITEIKAPAMAERTMLVSLSIRQWTARKLDKKATARVIRDAKADASAGNFHKLLLDDAVKPIQQVVTAARTRHAELTLPWLHNGTTILPADAFDLYSADMRRYREQFEKAVREFLDAYPSLVGQQARRLAEMFDQNDYPPVNQLAERFSWSIDVLPLPQSTDFRVDLGNARVAEIQAKIEARTRDAMQTAMADVWQRLHAAVDRMVTTLPEFKPATDGGRAQGVFRDSLVENVRELVEILPLLNIAGDAKLSEMIERARADLCRYDAPILRDREELREEVTKSAQSIMDDMAAFMGGN